jgi:hypothetical protein
LSSINYDVQLFREENQRLTSELQKYLAVESLSKEEAVEQHNAMSEEDGMKME